MLVAFAPFFRILPTRLPLIGFGLKKIHISRLIVSAWQLALMLKACGKVTITLQNSQQPPDCGYGHVLLTLSVNTVSQLKGSIATNDKRETDSLLTRFLQRSPAIYVYSNKSTGIPPESTQS